MHKYKCVHAMQTEYSFYYESSTELLEHKDKYKEVLTTLMSAYKPYNVRN